MMYRNIHVHDCTYVYVLFSRQLDSTLACWKRKKTTRNVPSKFFENCNC